MEKVRKLQFIGGQFLLNIPKSIVNNAKWEQGDYFRVAQIEQDTLKIKKVGYGYQSREQVMLPDLEQGARRTFAELCDFGNVMNPAEFAARLSYLTKTIAKMRKHKIKPQKSNTEANTI
ncbi:hypothetical protein HZB93_04630 [Candidatus Falkowbacteria bacterium]|nr:hypothetical protein [Candidatus Falkowbacteria bacterium]